MGKKANAFRIVGTGVAIPDRILTNEEIQLTRNSYVDKNWVVEKLGIRERRIADRTTLTSDLAATSARAALLQADVTPESIDLLIVATATPDRQAPSTASITQAKVGLGNAVSFDISAVCSGFLFGLTTAAAFINAGRAKRALVIGADTFSRIIDWQRKDCVFFGDGAGAAIIEKSSENGAFFDAELYTDGTKADEFTVLRGESTFTMRARGVRDAANFAVPRCVGRLLRRNSFTTDDIDVVVPHQPSVTLLQEIAQRTGVPFRKFLTNMDRYANTAGATIPIVLHELFESRKVKIGDLVMFAAAGAGFTAGAALYRWH